MSSTPKEIEKNLGKDLKTFDQLPLKTRELEMLIDEAEKSIDPKKVDLQKKIRDIALFPPDAKIK
jgi:hypothetical protein